MSFMRRCTRLQLLLCVLAFVVSNSSPADVASVARMLRVHGTVDRRRCRRRTAPLVRPVAERRLDQVLLRGPDGRTRVARLDVRHGLGADLLREAHRLVGVPPAMQRLVCEGREIAMDQGLWARGVRPDATVHVMLRLFGGMQSPEGAPVRPGRGRHGETPL